MTIFSVEQFSSIFNEYKNEKLLQENALVKLDELYKSAIKENQKKIKKILKCNEFFQNTEYSDDEIIILLDKSKNCTSKIEREKHTEIIEDILKNYFDSLNHNFQKKKREMIVSGLSSPFEISRWRGIIKK